MPGRGSNYASPGRERSCSPSISSTTAGIDAVKSGWRKAGARSVDELYEVVSSSLPSVTAADARGVFANRGFRFA